MSLDGFSEFYIDKSPDLERNCRKGKKHETIGNKDTCKHKFDLVLTDDQIKLRQSYFTQNEYVFSSEYCITYYNGSGLNEKGATLCVDMVSDQTSLR